MIQQSKTIHRVVPQSSSKYHLLIVDDKVRNPYSYATALKEYGYDITYAQSGESALEQVKASPRAFDLALVDQVLHASMDGRQLTRELSKYNPLLPVILFTGKNINTDEDLYGEANEDDWSIEDDAYLYLELQKGGFTLNQLHEHCQDAIRDRDYRWLRLLQRISGELHQLELDQVLRSCAMGLAQLGYPSGIIYRYVPSSWVTTQSVAGPMLAEQHPCLHCMHAFPASEPPETIDLTEDPVLKDMLASGEPVAIREHTGSKQILITLRSEEAGVGDLLGLLLLNDIPLEDRLDAAEKSRLKTLGHHISMALKNALTHRQLTYRQLALDQVLATNHRILGLSGSTHDEINILDSFAAAIGKALGFRRVAISIVKEIEGTVEVRGLSGLPPDEARANRGQIIPRAEFERLHEQHFKHGNSYFIPEGTIESAKYNGLVLPPQSYTALPWEWHPGDMLRTKIIDAEGKILGYISADERRGQNRPDEDIFRGLEVFATQIAVAIGNLQHYRTINAIKEVADQFSNTADQSVGFKKLQKQLARLMYAEHLTIGRYYKEREEIEILYRPPQDQNLPTRRSAHYGLSGYIVRTGRHLLFRHGTKDFHDTQKVKVLGTPAISWLGVPMKVDGAVIGFIALQDFERECVYDRGHLRVLNILADSVAVALRRIELEEENTSERFKIVSSVGVELIREKISIPAIERYILSKACSITGAYYGVILHYNRETNALDYGERYIPKKLRDTISINELPRKSLPMKGDGDKPTSLAVQAAIGRKPRRWDNVHADSNYTPVLKRTQSQFSVPLTTETTSSDYREGLLGVLSLESPRPEAFKQWHQDAVVALGQYVTQALLRDEEREQRDSLLGWSMYNLPGRFIHHKAVNAVQVLAQQLGNTNTNLDGLRAAFKETLDEADEIVKFINSPLMKTDKIRLNAVLEDFQVAYGGQFSYPAIDLQYAPHLPDDRMVKANTVWLREILRILVENAFRILLRNLDGGDIEISTDEDKTKLLLRVFSTTPKLSAPVVRFILDRDELWDDKHESFSYVKLVASLYGGLLRIAQNDEAGVALVIEFPKKRFSPKAMERRQKTSAYEHQFSSLKRIVSGVMSAQFAQEVLKRGRTLEPNFRLLNATLNEVSQSIEKLRSEIKIELNRVEELDLEATLAPIISNISKQKRYKSTPIQFVPELPEPTIVKANQLGLDHVLEILIDNAHKAISRNRAKGDGPARVITVRIVKDGKHVLIKVHNSGPVIPKEIVRQLFRWPILKGNNRKDRHGIGLAISKLLLDKYEASISLTQNDSNLGVEFTIRLSHVEKTEM